MTTSDLPAAYGGFTPEPVPEPAPAAAAAAGPPRGGRRRGPGPRGPVTRVTNPPRDQPTENQLTARAAVDTASVFGFGRSGQNLGAQIGAIRNLLMRTLVDDDGISVHQEVEQVVPRPDGNGPDDLVTVESLVPRDEYGDPEPGYTPEWSLSEVSYRAPDGELFDSARDAATHCRDHGSSLRRFTAIMDDDSLSVEQSALEEILDYLMTEAADRPTRRSSASSPSRRRTGR